MGEAAHRSRQRRESSPSTVSAILRMDWRTWLIGDRRYGEQADVDERHPLVKTLFIPSPILHDHKLEILIHTINPTTEPTKDGAASFLVPGLDIANSASGRPATITYPVHKVLMYEEGLNSLATFATMGAHADQRPNGQMFKGVIDWSWSISQQEMTQDQPMSPINLALAEAAIDVFRQSLDKSMEYEHLWFDAGMPSLSGWLSEGTESQSGVIKPAIRWLIQSICDTANQAIQQDELMRLEKEKAEMIPVATKNIIDQGISIWAENAHTELRDRLNVAFNSKSWRKTKWWKLFWRVDDVGYIASDILQRAWLVESEKEMIWISGRIHQSGLLGPPKLRPTPMRDPDDDEPRLGRAPRQATAEDVVPKASVSDFTEPPPIIHPWPQDISRARSVLSILTIPPLQSLSQALLLQTISTNVLAFSLSALLYVSVSTTSVYEAGAIAAVGLVYSLRRLQKRWDSARDEWEAELSEDGRRVLRNVEQNARDAVREGGVPEVDELGMEERRIAKEAVERVRGAMEDLKR